MIKLGSQIEETGLLLREGDMYLLRRDLGGRFRLATHRVEMPVGDQRVQVTGVLVGADLVDVSTVTPEKDRREHG